MNNPDPPSPRTITLDLIRKRSEHNEGMVSNLEEIALHQEELEALGPVLGRTCGKTLRILLLQNNVISKLSASDLRQFKVIEYLNLALNNVEVVEGIQHLELLNKLDLTLNFIDIDRLEESVEHMKHLRSLRELYLMGNTCCAQVDKDCNDEIIDFQVDMNIPYNSKAGWRGYRMFVVASLPQLSNLDGKDITRSERIKATQKLPFLKVQLRKLAELCRDSKNKGDSISISTKAAKDDEMIPHTPQSRHQISNEMAVQKAEKEERQRANQPKHRGEKEFEIEQEVAIKKAREREREGRIMQCNEGKWNYRFDEEKKLGFLLLDLALPKFLSSSLIDVDIHPTYVCIVVKSKVLRLILPVEIKSDNSTAQRSITTGHLLITMPKVDPKENVIGRESVSSAKRKIIKSRTKKVEQSKGISELLLEATGVKTMTNDKTVEIGLNEISSKKKESEGSTYQTSKHNADSSSDEEDPPPIF